MATRSRRRAIKRNRAWTAALMSMLVPGLGHVYVGQVRAGVGFYLLFLAGLVVGLVSFLLVPKAGVNAAFAFGIWLPVYIVPIISAGRAARKLTEDFQPAYRLYVWIAVVLVGTLFAQGFNRTVGALLVKTKKTTSRSMEPTLLPGDRLMVNKLTYAFRKPRRGDIVAIAHPGAPLDVVFKRVVAMPGEQIAIHDYRALINGEPIQEDYVWLAEQEDNSTADLSAVSVGENEYFVLGDRRNRSVDSRQWGTIAADEILGPVTRVSIHVDPQTHRIRWGRIGKPIQSPFD